MSKTKKIILVIIAVLLCIAAVAGYKLYDILYTPNVITKGETYLYIPSNSNFDDLIKILNDQKIIKSENNFRYAAKLMKYNTVRAGRYKITNDINNKELVSLLRSSKQAPIRLTLAGNIRTNEKIASIASKYIEADSVSILQSLNDDALLEPLGFNHNNVIAMFIPNTYELYWNTSAKKLIERMHSEYNKFWDENRLKKLESINFTQQEVAIIASIVDEETNAVGEMPRIAGVYINRLKIGMLLQADPTVKFAIGDFTIRRVLTKHLEYDSPYNTYKYKGLPPAPICMPSIAAIDAVLNYEHHDYYYFCAKDDFSGKHAFAKTFTQHLTNAKAYQRALDQLNIKK